MVSLFNHSSWYMARYEIPNLYMDKQYLRYMAACSIHRFYHCLHIQMHSHLRLSPFIHSNARYLACSQRSLPLADWNQLANRLLKFTNGRRSCMGRNICNECHKKTCVPPFFWHLRVQQLRALCPSSHRKRLANCACSPLWQSPRLLAKHCSTATE